MLALRAGRACPSVRLTNDNQKLDLWNCDDEKLKTEIGGRVKLKLYPGRPALNYEKKQMIEK